VLLRVFREAILCVLCDARGGGATAFAVEPVIVSSIPSAVAVLDSRLDVTDVPRRKAREPTASRDQIRGRSLIDDTSGLEHDHVVRAFDHRVAMRDDEGRRPLSCRAAVRAPVIRMSQNRQAEKDRLDARLDYDVNLKAELEILALHEKLGRRRGELLEIQERQLALLDRIERTLGSRA
jgi:hypothetical protein